jgi:ribosomal protein S18 acetylase RimI-like enzyme
LQKPTRGRFAGSVGDNVGKLMLCRHLAPELRLDAAVLAYKAVPALYEPVAGGAVLEAIASDFLVDGSEVSGAEASVVNTTVQGIVAGFPAAELAARQGVGLHHMLGALPPDQLAPFVAHIRSFSAGVPSIPGEGRYLARLAVAESQRGSGLADRLLLKFLSDDGADAGTSLHVRADNGRAIAFYARHGFRSQGGDQPYVVMLRP